MNENIKSLNMEELEMVSGGTERSEKQSESISKLIEVITDWLFS